MAFPNPTYEQIQKMREVNIGDLVKVTSGEIYEFRGLKQKTFSGINQEDKKPYRVAITTFVEVVGHNEGDPEQVVKVKRSDSWKTLRQGELFFINYRNRIEVYRFRGTTPTKIKAVHPTDSNRGLTIDIALYGGKLSELA